MKVAVHALVLRALIAALRLLVGFVFHGVLLRLQSVAAFVVVLLRRQGVSVFVSALAVFVLELDTLIVADGGFGAVALILGFRLGSRRSRRQ